MIGLVDRNSERLRIHKRIRTKVFGTSERPRLCVYRSSRYIYAQIVDDSHGRTLAAASTIEKELRSECKGTGNIEASKLVGRKIAERAKNSGIDAVVFDRGGYLYHGRVKAVAEAARESGLNF